MGCWCRGVVFLSGDASPAVACHDSRLFVRVQVRRAGLSDAWTQIARLPCGRDHLFRVQFCAGRERNAGVYKGVGASVDVARLCCCFRVRASTQAMTVCVRWRFTGDTPCPQATCSAHHPSRHQQPIVWRLVQTCHGHGAVHLRCCCTSPAGREVQPRRTPDFCATGRECHWPRCSWTPRLHFLGGLDARMARDVASRRHFRHGAAR